MISDSMEGGGALAPFIKTLYPPGPSSGHRELLPAQTKKKFDAEVKNARSYSFSFPYAFMARYTGT